MNGMMKILDGKGADVGRKLSVTLRTHVHVLKLALV